MLRTGRNLRCLYQTRVSHPQRGLRFVPLDAKVSLAEKFKPGSAATFGSSTSVRMYQTFFYCLQVAQIKRQGDGPRACQRSPISS
jgi:hypothetical protein